MPTCPELSFVDRHIQSWSMSAKLLRCWILRPTRCGDDRLVLPFVRSTRILVEESIPQAERLTHLDSGCIYNSGSCASRITGAYATTAISHSNATSTNLVVTTAAAGVAEFIGLFPTIQVAWATSDLPLFTPASAPILNNIPATSTASTKPPPSGGIAGLSAGTKAGIAIGVIVAALLLGGALAFFVIRWRRAKRNRQALTPSDAHTKAELPGYGMEMHSPRHHPYAELGPEGTRSEMGVDAKSPVVKEGGRQSVWHELEGDFTPVEMHGNAPPLGVVIPRLDEKGAPKR
jgi:hypothetical protein